jgi:hypothetical protein
MSHSLKAAAQDILFSGEAYRNFVCSARSEATKNAYTKALRLYMKFKGLIDCEQLLKGEPKITQSNIIEWLIHLKEVQNLSYASISLYCTALHHFYEMNDIAGLNWKKIGSFIGGEYQDGKGQAIYKRRNKQIT